MKTSTRYQYSDCINARHLQPLSPPTLSGLYPGWASYP